jgi:hypothetical protein
MKIFLAHPLADELLYCNNHLSDITDAILRVILLGVSPPFFKKPALSINSSRAII